MKASEKFYLTIGVLAGKISERWNLDMYAALNVAANLVTFFDVMENALTTDEFNVLIKSTLVDAIDSADLMKNGKIEQIMKDASSHRIMFNMLMQQMYFNAKVDATVNCITEEYATVTFED